MHCFAKPLTRNNGHQRCETRKRKKKSRAKDMGVKTGHISCCVCVGPTKQGGVNKNYI